VYKSGLNIIQMHCNGKASWLWQFIEHFLIDLYLRQLLETNHTNYRKSLQVVTRLCGLVLI